MKILYILAFSILFLHNLIAQDTLLVDWSFDGVKPAVNNLYNVIMSDTARPEGRVYKLLRGGYYLQDSSLFFNFPLRIVGENSGQTTETAPAVIQIANQNKDNDVNILTGESDLELKNLWLTGVDTLGNQESYQPIQLEGSDKHYVFDHCVFTQTNFAFIGFNSTDGRIIIKNNVFRNLIGKPATQQWQGRGISIWADQDSVIIENNTFFNIGMTAFQFEGAAAKFLLFVHNTIVNTGWTPVQGFWWHEAYFADNLIVNGFWYGITPSMMNDINSNYREYGLLNIDDLPASYGPNVGRRIFIKNNGAWSDSAFDSYYADSISVRPFISSETNRDFIESYEQMIVLDTIWADPGLKTQFSTEFYDNMIQNIKDLRAGVTPVQEYFWMLPVKQDSTICYSCINWPLTEDFSYINSGLQTASLEGLALGDLNWFPEDKHLWETNREQYVSAITQWPHSPDPYIVWQAEAEEGELTSNAIIDTTDGILSFLMSAGYIKWDFDLDEAGQYDLDVLVDLNNRASSGVNFIINDNEIHDPRSWGQYIFGIDEPSLYPGFPASGLDWWRIRQQETIEYSRDGSQFLNLPKGNNSIEIHARWCDNYFGGINILNAGTENVVKFLSPLYAEYYAVSLYADGNLAPGNFRTVKISEEGGTVSWQTEVEETGYYYLFVLGKAYEGPQPARIYVNRQQVINDFNISERASLQQNISGKFLLSAGKNRLSLSSQNIELDKVFLALGQIIVNTEDDSKVPKKFELKQNYPNPFNPLTTISYQIAKNCNVTMKVYDLMGKEVVTLINQKQSAGKYQVTFNAKNLASGIYFYLLEAGNYVSQKKMLLIK